MMRASAGAVALCLASLAAAERAPVVDSLPMGGAAQELPRGNVPPAQSTPYYGPASRVNPQAELLYQLDLLQQEVQNLRGQLEQYANDITRMRQEGDARYRGLDERMTGMEKNIGELGSRPAVQAAPAIDPQMFLENPELLNDPKVLDALDKLAQPPAAAAVTEAPAVIPDVAPAAVAAASGDSAATDVATPPPSTIVQAQAVPLPDNEKEAYEFSRELIKRREFSVAAATLQSFISKFPGGEYEGHAWYWLGEVYMVIPDAQAAKAAFNHLLSNFPLHPKEADATYKLAVVHDQLGDPVQARSYFERVIAQYEGTSAASLASNYMRFMRPAEKTDSGNTGEEGGN